MSAAMQIIADQKEEIAKWRKHVAIIENRQQEQQNYLESIKEMQEAKKQLAATLVKHGFNKTFANILARTFVTVFL